MDERNSTIKTILMIAAAIALIIFLPGIGITLVMMYLVYKFRRHVWILPMAGLVVSLLIYSGIYAGAFFSFFTR